MADGLTTQSTTLATVPDSTKIATDDAGAPGHVQIVKLAIATDGSATALPGDATDGLLVNLGANNDVTFGRDIVRKQVTPTISTTAYTAKDNIGGLMTFSNAASVSGGAIRIDAVQIVDQDQEFADLDLVLFDRTITAPTDNAAFGPTDAELDNCIGVVPIGQGMYADFNGNAVAVLNNLELTAVLNGTDLFGVLVARSGPTYTSTSDLTVSLTIEQF